MTATSLDRHVRERRAEMESVESGVTVFWLAKHFGLQVSTVRQKLAGCPTIGKKGGGALYALKDAAEYLVKPKMDPEVLLRTMKPQDLPPSLQQNFWAAANARLKWEREAAELWHTSDVIEAFGDTFKRIKFNMQLFPDTLERMAGLSDEQRKAVVHQCDQLLDEIYASIREATQNKATASVVARLEDLLAEAQSYENPDDGAEDNDDLL